MPRSGRIRPSPLPPSPYLKFSFKHLDCSSEKFAVRNCHREDFWHNLLLRIKEYSQWTVDQFRDQNHQTNEHRHTIHFPETSEPDGFTNVDQENLALEEPWQFSVNPVPECIGRVHGLLQEDTFYVIWLDPCHRLFLKPFSC
jgi:hypothetical protein